MTIRNVAAPQAAAGPAAPKRFEAFEWNQDQPERAVSRRISRHFNFKGPGPTVLADIEGPGCIRRFWITGDNIGRDVILRIYFDDEPVPYVEAPLTDFFGAMHNLMANPYPHDHARRERPEEAYVVNTPFLAIKPKSGMTAYFAMPFATRARVEVTGSERSTRLYYTLDWHDYPGQEMKEPMRFVARATLTAPADTTATLTLAWDDQLVLRINDGEPIDLGSQPYVRGRTVEVPLRKGENTIALWLSNEMGLTRGTWVFSLRAVTAEGDVLLPEAPGEPAPEPTAWRVEPDVLVAHWPLSETGGQVAADASGNEHHGTLAPAMTDAAWITGPRGGAVRLNGRDQYVRVSGPLAWADCGRLPFTLAAWVRTTDSGTNAVLYRKAFAENPKFELDMEDGKARFRLRNRTGREFRADSDGTPVADGQWRQLAGVKDADSLRLYVDGKRVATTPLPDGAGSFTTEQAAYWHIGSCVELAGQTLGLIGCGHIGRLVAEMAGALGMDAVAYDVAPREDVATAPGFRYAPLDDVLRTADFLSLHCPAMPCCRPSCSSRRNSTRPKSITRASSGQKLVGTGRMGGRRQLRPGAGGVRGHRAGHAGVRPPRGNLDFRLDSTFVE